MLKFLLPIIFRFFFCSIGLCKIYPEWKYQNSLLKLTTPPWQFYDCDLFGMEKTWPFQKVAGDLQRLGRTMVRAWITWPEFPWYLFVKGSKYQRRHDVGSQNSRFEARRFQVPKSGNWCWKMMVLLRKSVKSRHLPPKHDPHLSCRKFL